MIQRENPFPAMNPFFENRWMDAHSRLISYLADALNSELPDDLTAQVEEAIRVGGGRPAFRADVAVVESWQRGFPPLWQPEGIGQAEPGLALTATDPYIIDNAEDPSRWIEIRTLSGELVTVIELLSPANKKDDRCHINGRYWQLRDLASLTPVLSEEDSQWATERLRMADSSS